MTVPTTVKFLRRFWAHLRVTAHCVWPLNIAKGHCPFTASTHGGRQVVGVIKGSLFRDGEFIGEKAVEAQLVRVYLDERKSHG